MEGDRGNQREGQIAEYGSTTLVEEQNGRTESGGWSEGHDSFKKKLARNSLKWTGHVERMRVETLAKRSIAQKVEKKRRR